MSTIISTDLSIPEVFPGLHPYGPTSAGQFRGRARQVEDLLSILQSSRFLGIVAPEGAGKTSLVMAGLMPALQQGFKGLAGTSWQICHSRPGITPLENLAFALSSIDPQSVDAKTSLERQADFSAMFRSDHTGLIRAVGQLGLREDENLVVFIDHFEDLFELSSKYLFDMDSEQEAALLVSNLARLLSMPSLPVYVVLSLRSEYIPSLYNFRSLHAYLGTGLYSLPMFRNDDFDDIIRQGMQHLGIKADQEVIDAVQVEFANDMRNLPALQAWLTSAVERYRPIDRGGPPSGLQSYEASMIGTLEDKIPAVIEAFYTSLGEREQHVMCQLFSHITLPGDGQVTKKPQSLREVCDRRGIPKPELNDFIRRIECELAGVLTVTEPYSRQIRHFQEHTYPKSSVVNLTNPYLLRGWKRLGEWVEEERQATSLYLRLSEAARMYGLGQTALLRPPDLDLFDQWWNSFHPQPSWPTNFNTNYRQTEEYLQESVENHRNETERMERERKEELRKARKRVVIGLTVGVISLLFALAAVYFSFVAKKAEIKATVESENALKKKKLADLFLQQSKVSESKAIRSAEEAERERGIATKKKLEADSASRIAKKNFEKAMVAEADAKDKARIARENAEEARQKQKEADESADRARVAEKEAQQRATFQSAAKQVLDLLLKARTSNFDQRDSIISFLHDVSSAYVNFDTSSRNLNGSTLPDNNLFELLWVADTQVRDSLRGKSVSRKLLHAFPADRGERGMRDVAVFGKERLAVVGDYSSPVVCELSSGKCRVLAMEDKTERFRAIEFVDRDRLVTADVYGNLFRLELSKTDNVKVEPLQELQRKEAIVNGLAIAGGEALVVIDGRLYAANIAKPNGLREVPHNSRVEGVFPVDNKQAIVAGAEGLMLYDPTRRALTTINTPNPLPQVTAVAQSGGWLFTGNARGLVMAYELVNGNVRELRQAWPEPLNAHRTQVTSLRYDPAEARLYSAGLDRNANIYSMQLPRQFMRNYAIRLVGFRKWIWDFEMVPGPNGTTLYSTDESGSLLSWVTQPSEMHRRLGEFLKTEAPRRP